VDAAVKLFVTILIILLSGSLTARDRVLIPRKWVDKQGRSLTAKFMGFGTQKDTVILVDAQGVQMTLPIAVFSEADQNFFKAEQKYSEMTKTSQRTSFQIGSDPNGPQTGREYRAVLGAERDRLKKELRKTPLYTTEYGHGTASNGERVMTHTTVLAPTAARHRELSRQVEELQRLIAEDRSKNP
jgi:hypothetical protein